MHTTSTKALSFGGRVGVDGSKFTTFHAVSRILYDDEPADLTHASTHSLETFSISYLASGKPQTAATRLQFRVAEISNFSKAFSSVHFYLAKIQYNTRIHIGIVRLQGSPEETRRLYEAWAPQSKRNKQNKMIFAK